LALAPLAEKKPSPKLQGSKCGAGGLRQDWGLHPCKTGPDRLTGAESKQTQYGARAAKAECYILRIKATVRRGKPPWKCTWQTVMAP